MINILDPVEEADKFLNEFDYQKNRPNLKLFSQFRLDVSDLTEDLSIQVELIESKNESRVDLIGLNKDIIISEDRDTESLF